MRARANSPISPAKYEAMSDEDHFTTDTVVSHEVTDF